MTARNAFIGDKEIDVHDERKAWKAWEPFDGF
jgi:hypothetical protein